MEIKIAIFCFESYKFKTLDKFQNKYILEISARNGLFEFTRPHFS